MREKIIEAHLVKRVKMHEGLCLKFISPSLDGVPDRIILMPNGKMAFAEIKAMGGKMRPLQVKRKRQLEALGFKVYCIDNPDKISRIIHEVTGGDME